MKPKTITIENIKIGNHLPFVLVAGPDSLESAEHALFIAKTISLICRSLDIPYVFKASYDKANRTAIDSWRGLGLKKGLKIFQKIKKELQIPVTTDIHSKEEAIEVGKIVDLIQIPALLSRQTDIIVAAASTGKAVNVKKGQFMAPEDIGGVIGKIRSTRNENIIVTERGTTFGYHNVVADMRSLEVMKHSGYPVIFDASHTVQLPSILGKSSGGQRELIPALARAAIGVGVAGIFLEVHDKPGKAPVDGQNSLDMKDLGPLLQTLWRIDRVVKEKAPPPPSKKARSKTYELWVRAPYKEFILRKRINMVIRPGDRRYPNPKGVKEGKPALIKILKEPGSSYLGVLPIFDDFETKIKIKKIEVKKIKDIGSAELKGCSPDCKNKELLPFHLGLIYNRKFTPRDLVSLIYFDYD